MGIKWQRHHEPAVDGLFIAMIKTFDIPETIAACIKNARPGMVAIVLSRRGGSEMIQYAEDAAVERRKTHPEFRRIIWWYGPRDQFQETGP